MVLIEARLKTSVDIKWMGVDDFVLNASFMLIVRWSRTAFTIIDWVLVISICQLDSNICII